MRLNIYGILGIFLAALFTGCVSKPTHPFTFVEAGQKWVYYMNGITPNLSSYSTGQTYYTPKPGYRFVSVVFGSRTQEGRENLWKRKVKMVTRLGNTLEPQFHDAFSFEANTEKATRIGYIFIVSNKDLPLFVILPNGTKVNLDSFFGES